MKNISENSKITILCPHPDDEFLGCRKFIQSYFSQIESIIFFTNGEFQLKGFADPFYPLLRRAESESWLDYVGYKNDIHYLNYPDNVSPLELFSKYGNELFEKYNGKNRLLYILDEIRDIMGNNIMVIPNREKHPTHLTLNELVGEEPNHMIMYMVHTLWGQKRPQYGLYKEHSKIEDIDFKVLTYSYSDKEHEQKVKEFKEFYPTQEHDFSVQGMSVPYIEQYVGELDFDLCIQ